jgi:hypothetical protein
MRNLLVLVLFLLTTAPVFAQGGKIAFEKTVHDFGEIKEGTIATYTFGFKNEGRRPLRLVAVRASCGCTTPEYSREPVAPGETGFIKVAYDSNGRPGIIDKDVTVQTDGDPVFVTLLIKGAVMNDKIKGPQLTQLGNLLFNEGTINAGSVKIGSSFSHSVEYQVTGSRGIKILKVEAPSDVEVKHFQFTAQPQEIFQFSIYFNPSTSRRPGTFNEAITFVTDDPVMPRKTVFLSGVVTPSND